MDTADVLHRIRLASVPFGSTFMTTVQDKPDLCVRLHPARVTRAMLDARHRSRGRYGPFWIAATLVFIAAATGNLASYLAYLNQLSAEPDAVWAYDIKKVSLSAVLFYGYISVLPLMVRALAAKREAQEPLTLAAHLSFTLHCATGRRPQA